MTVRSHVKRPLISKTLQVKVFRRDAWLCQYCGCPVVFPPALRLMEVWLRPRLPAGQEMPAYYHERWRRDRAPLLDQLGVVVDHRVAAAKGGGIDETNLLTACNKCNTRKSDTAEDKHRARNPRRRIRAKYGEPKMWDGLSAMFLALARDNPDAVSTAEREWEAALAGVVQSTDGP